MRKKIVLCAGVLMSLVLAVATFQEVCAAEKTMRIKIPMCICDSTDANTRVTLRRVDGVKSAEVNPAGQSATVVFDDTKTNFEQIRDALRGAGVTVVGKPEYVN